MVKKELKNKKAEEESEEEDDEYVKELMQDNKELKARYMRIWFKNKYATNNEFREKRKGYSKKAYVRTTFDCPTCSCRRPLKEQLPGGCKFCVRVLDRGEMKIPDDEKPVIEVKEKKEKKSKKYKKINYKSGDI